MYVYLSFTEVGSHFFFGNSAIETIFLKTRLESHRHDKRVQIIIKKEFHCAEHYIDFSSLSERVHKCPAGGALFKPKSKNNVSDYQNITTFQQRSKCLSLTIKTSSLIVAFTKDVWGH